MEVGELLPRLSILTAQTDGGLFLLPFSGGYPRLTLSAILPCDARTFLTGIPFGMIPRGRPTKLPYYYNTFLSESQDIFLRYCSDGFSDFSVRLSLSGSVAASRRGPCPRLQPGSCAGGAGAPPPAVPQGTAGHDLSLSPHPAPHLPSARAGGGGYTAIRAGSRNGPGLRSYGSRGLPCFAHSGGLPRRMVWRLCTTRGGSVFATVRDHGDSAPLQVIGKSEKWGSETYVFPQSFLKKGQIRRIGTSLWTRKISMTEYGEHSS